ncbi:MAG: HD domain-containing protein [Phycisphaerales bacterium]|nr:HD domain-containing protein [Phycisphaerales bacterium]
MKITTLRDPVHGDIELTAEEIAVIDTPEFQRLRGIKQLGTSYLVFPGATHTRFEHSIGTLHMTERLLTAMDRNAERAPSLYRRIEPAERRVLRVAALLHDITHIPFGHNIEDQTGLLTRHDRPERFRAALTGTEVGAVLERLGLRAAVLGVLAGDAADQPAFFAQVLSDTIDADLMDYLRRDAYYTGLELRYDQRVLTYFAVDRASGRMFVDCEKAGMLRDDVMSEVVRMLETRYHFSERVYYHHAKIAAGALLARMVEVAMRAGALAPADLQAATDQSLLDSLARAELGDSASTARLRRFVERFHRRQLPKRVLVLPAYLNGAVQATLLSTYFTPGKPQARFAWEAALEERARREFGRDMDVIMYCPARRMQLKEARTLVRLPGSGERILPLSAFADQVPRVRDLETSYPRLWKLYVFTSEVDRDVRRRLQEMCLATLPPGCANALSL